LPSWTGQVTAK